MSTHTWILTSAAALVLVLAAGCGSEDEAAKPAEKTDAQTKNAADATPYPLATCTVSGEKLDAMGEPAVLVHGKQQMKFCCKKCVLQFKKEPEKFIKMLTDAGDPKGGESHKGHTGHEGHDH